jgi:hypothetical protein
VDLATPAQLQAAHEALKVLAKGWWHNAANVWIVFSEAGHGEVRNVTSEAVRQAGGTARVLVLKLPDNKSDRHWASVGLKDEANDWLWRTYFGSEPPK